MEHSELFSEIRKIEIVTRTLVNEQLAGQYYSVFKGRGMAFDEVRQYQLGDDVRSIDWNVSARMNEPYIKVFAEEREMTVMLVVDVSASGAFGTIRQTKARLAAKLAAIFAFSAIRNSDRVGLILFSDRVERFVPPKKGRKHVLRLVSEILRFAPDGHGTRIAAGLDYLGHVARRRAVAVLISDFIDEGYDSALKLAARRHDLIPICISDPAEKAFPEAGLVNLVDPETGAACLVDTSSRKVRAAFASAVSRMRATREQLFRRNRIDFINISTDDADMSALVNFFKLRARRSMRMA